MVSEHLHTFLVRLRHVLGSEADGGVSDTQLLQRFVSQRDATAFEVLVWRHAGLVLDICGRWPLQSQDTEDVFQATFLTLARKAGSIANGNALGGWLTRVATRVVQRLRGRADRLNPTALGCLDPPAPAAERGIESDLRPILDEEIRRLPEKYRVPVVLCYLEGRTTQEAAQQMGCARGTICSRLFWARQRLRAQLTRRGLALSTAALVSALEPGRVSAALVSATVKAAVAFASGQGLGGTLPGRAVTLAEGVMRTMLFTRLKMIAALGLVLGVLGLGAGLCQQGIQPEKTGSGETPTLVTGRGDGVRLPPNHPARVGLQTTEVQARLREPQVLRWPGSLAFDPDYLMRVRCRFPSAEVVELGKADGVTPERPLQPGDRVRKGQLLAVLRSSDVRAKKIELLDALLQLALDEEILAKAEKAEGAVPEIALLTARRNVLVDQNAVARNLNILAAWNLPEADIKAVEAEADRISKGKGKRDPEKEKQWARVELRAPIDGTLVERNLALHENVVDTSVNLFQIGNVDRLRVVVQVPEGDLPILEALPPERRRWTIQTAGSDPVTVQGRIEQIGVLIDPNLGTAVVSGDIENPQYRLRPGQFITASISLPRTTDEVVLPVSALIEADGRTWIFVQPDPKQAVYEQRRVLVVRRGPEVIHLRSRLTPEQEREGYQTLRPGERAVTAKVTELKALLDDLKGRGGR
jgi:cobalt-zinc-cadmium efflux system membrane fusion protein